MGTIILAGIIFLGVARVVYKYGVKKEKTCDCSSADCPIKKETISDK
ncbi:FeoB-associated Cys-rich membrane protein [Vagococcus bubulae]|nr:FeoB-associated Cys-rich membrane protein [Vagococcus bubulae]